MRSLLSSIGFFAGLVAFVMSLAVWVPNYYTPSANDYFSNYAIWVVLAAVAAVSCFWWSGSANPSLRVTEKSVSGPDAAGQEAAPNRTNDAAEEAWSGLRIVGVLVALAFGFIAYPQYFLEIPFGFLKNVFGAYSFLAYLAIALPTTAFLWRKFHAPRKKPLHGISEQAVAQVASIPGAGQIAKALFKAG